MTGTEANFSTLPQEATQKITGYLWLSFAICFLSNIFAGLISTLMSVYLPVVTKDLTYKIGAERLSNISAYINALYLAGWAVGGFMWGIVSDKIGRARALALSAGTFGLFTIFISFSTSWEMVVVFRLLSGLAVGGILVICPILLSEIWPVKSRSVIIGIDSIGFPIGIFSSGVVNLMVPNWREAFWVGAMPLALALIVVWGVQESENWRHARSNPVLKAARNPEDTSNLIKGAIIFGSMLIGLWGMFSWIPTWVQSLLPDSEGQQQRGIAMMVLGAGGLTGGFISGWVSNALGVRKAMLFCFSMCIFMSVLLFGTNNTFSNVIYIELSLLSLFFGISQGLLSIYVPQLFPFQIRGTYTGICFNVGRIVTAVAVFFVGVLVTVLGGYGNALLSFAGIFVAGFIAVSLTSDKNKTTT